MLFSKDLIIRNSNFQDIDFFYKWELKAEVSNYFSIDKNQSYDKLIRTFVLDDEDMYKKQYTIILKDRKVPIGRIVLNDINKGWKTEIYRIYIGDLSQRNKGYGKQAMEVLMSLTFEKWHIERLYLDYYVGNPAAKLYKSLGFKEEGILRKSCKKDDKFYDVHLLSMIREEYLDKYK